MVNNTKSYDNFYQKHSGTDILQFLYIFTVTTVLVWYINFLLNRRKLYWYARKFPGPFALPFIGSSYVFLKASGWDIMSIIMNCMEKYDGLCRFWTPTDLCILISNPKDIEIVLNNNAAIEKAKFYDVLSIGLGHGLLTMPGSSWKQHRKSIAPSFNQKILVSFVEIFVEKGKIFIDKTHNLIGNKDINWYVFASRCTLDIVCQTAMGVNMNIQSTDEEGIGEIIDGFLELANQKIFRFYNYIPIYWKFSKTCKQLNILAKKLHRNTSRVVQKKMEEYNKQKELLNEDCIFEDTKKKNLAFLDFILEHANFNRDELEAEIGTFLAAGTETSAATLCAVFTMLAMFPNIQDKVYEEITEILGPDRDVHYSDLPYMKYTERVIMETLRLFPIGAMFGRRLTDDIQIGDGTLPAGCIIGIIALYIHRNPKYWKDPLKFNPDRFLPEEIAKRHPCTYLPFSYGPRNCIGRQYSILLLKTLVAMTVRQFRIFTEYKSVEEIEVKLQLLLRFRHGFKLSFEPRVIDEQLNSKVERKFSKYINLGFFGNISGNLDSKDANISKQVLSKIEKKNKNV